MTTALRHEGGRRGPAAVLAPVPDAPRNRDLRLVLAFVAVVIIATLMATAVLHSQAVEVQADIDGSELQVIDRSRVLDEKVVELAKLRSPEHVAERAAALGYERGDGPDRIIGPVGSAQVAGSDGPGDPIDPVDRRSDDPAVAGSELAAGPEGGSMP